MKIKELFKKVKLKIKQKIDKMIEEEQKQYTFDCFGNRVKREILSEEELKRLLKKIEDADKEGKL